MRHLIRQSLLQRTLRDTRIVQVTEAAAHAGRAIASLLRRASLLGRQRRQAGLGSVTL